MIRAGCGLSTRTDPRQAAEEACASALAGAERADAALLFAGPGLPDPQALLDAATGVLGTGTVAGATAFGVLAGGREEEGRPAVSVLALSGLYAQGVLLRDLSGDEATAGEEIAAHLGGPLGEKDLVVLLPDPRTLGSGPLLEGLRSALAPAAVVGAGAGDPVSDAPLQWYGREVASGALAALVLRGQRPPRIGVTQACRPASELLTVSRTEGHWILELEGRPALDVYREVARGPLAADLERAASFILAALPASDTEPLAPGGYLVRNVMGFAPDANAFAIPELPRIGQRIALVAREPEAAREDLKAMLAGLGSARPAAGLYLDCCARGAGFFGVPGLEAAYLENAFGPAPMAGMFGSCELGPIGGRTELLTYTGVLALIDA